MTTQPPPPRLVWLASYPRSGNTMLRTLMYQCFGLRSGSVYRNDLGGQPALEAAVGHIEHSANNTLDFGPQSLRLIKTHTGPRDASPAIYVIRDGRKATISMSHFYPNVPMRDIVEGRVLHFGTWASHVASWAPRRRKDTLLLRYEALTADFPGTIELISKFLKIEPTSLKMPSRDELAGLDGTWIRPETAPREELTGALLERFWEINGDVMRSFGYA